MKYEDIIRTVSSLVNDDMIYKKGLTLVYELDSLDHVNLNEEIFHMFNPMTEPFTPDEEFEILISSILIRFVKKK